MTQVKDKLEQLDLILGFAPKGSLKHKRNQEIKKLFQEVYDNGFEQAIQDIGKRLVKKDLQTLDKTKEYFRHKKGCIITKPHRVPINCYVPR